MTNIAKSIATVQQAYDVLGGKELSRRADVPYTTLLGWAAKGFKPGAVEVLEKLEAAAGNNDGVPDGVIPPASQMEASQNTEICGAECRTATGEFGGAA